MINISLFISILIYQSYFMQILCVVCIRTCVQTKVYQTFHNGNKSTTLIQYVTRNIYKENRMGLPRKLLKNGILGDSGSSQE